MKIDQVIEMLAAHIGAAVTSTAPYLFGISGGQGAGKSTLCDGLAARLSANGLKTIILGLDDFYLPKSARQKLARDISPLCAVRGVPGTHDIALMRRTIDRLMQAEANTQTPLPRFSKSHDEQVSEQDWPLASGRPDVILIEGWCVGGRADFLQNTAPTAWEQANDPHGIWKSWTLNHAAPYEAIWDLCADFMLLRHSDFDAVIDSRWQQEQGNAAASGVWQFASRDEVAAFCAHYESWTKAIWQHLPARARFNLRRDGADYQ